MKLRNLFAFAVVAAMSTQSLANAYTTAVAVGEDAGRIIAGVRNALGGEAAISEVKSLSLSGTVQRAGAATNEPGEFKFVFSTQSIEGGDVFVMRKKDMEEGATWTEAPEGTKKRVVKFENKIDGGGPFAPMGMGPEFIHMLFDPMFAKHATYAGEETVEGVRYDVLTFGGTRLYVDQATHLPAFAKGKGMGPMVIRAKRAPGGDTEVIETEERVVVRVDGIQGKTEGKECVVRFGDYRSVGALTLPHRFTSTVEGDSDTTEIAVREYQFNVPVERKLMIKKQQ